MKTRGIFAAQGSDISAIPHIKAATVTSLTDRVAFVTGNHQARSGRPATIKTLNSTLKSLFPGGLTEEEHVAVIESLKRKGVIDVVGTKVTYKVAS